MMRRIKKSTKQYIIVSFICFVVMGGAAASTVYMITGQLEDKYKALLTQARQEVLDNKGMVYVADGNIIRGDYITENNITKINDFTGQPKETLITSEDIGKIAIIDILKGTQILKGMLSDQTIPSELRELEYSVININANIVNNDTVDIRIAFPTGEDFVILSKKVLRGYTTESPICLLWLNEEEIIRMHSAIVDAYLYTGAYLYTTKYIEPNLQEPTVVTYVPSVEALSLIKENPNIVDTATNKLSIMVRKALENRLAESLSKDVNKQWDIKDNYIYPDKKTAAPAETKQDEINQEPETSEDYESLPTISPTPTPYLELPSDTQEDINADGADLGNIEQLEPELGAEYFMIGG